MSLRLLVAKHLGAKVLFFCTLSFSVYSAVATVVAHAKCLTVSCVQPEQTTVLDARDIKHILSCAPKHFSPGSPRLHKALMIWLFVESRLARRKQQNRHLFMSV